MNNDEVNFDKLNETELQAIGINNGNFINGTNYPEFPYLAVAFDELADVLAGIAEIDPLSSIQFAKEANVISQRLLELVPKAPTKDYKELMKLFSNEEIAEHLLNSVICGFLAGQLQQMVTKVLTQLEKVKRGGNNGKIH
ncbi:hypothetical protein [Avibacterium paragallinarum]|uniref:Uncharacterized protein n=1 Tax=Avibacterium paragallinarum TaxID=728 RepID=A0A0F5EZT7_AVIPA|nr:hypothetical protein [Avibacterium paragallinarum]KAA6209818.1 hypothetical protein F1968_02095 [Avibacterium paragallinarum]KKB01900.1 hypothetical protein Z012_03885 [Avibacterium paragallinarum]RZN61049.1 hypothetical protein EIG79_01900 [Avibacterium paragallinarum]RZN73301.1 hypothetical protein EIG77_03980 [Avibacterium paragallinarum]